MLQDVDWGFSSEEEHNVAEQLPLALGCFCTLFHGHDLWCVIELFVDNTLVVLSLVEELAGVGLHLSNLKTLVEFSVDRKVSLWHGVGESEIGVELVVNELKECHVELRKSAHYFVVNIEGEALVELVWLDPGELLAHDLDTVVDALDGEECLAEALADCAVQHEVFVKFGTSCNLGLRNIECQVLGKLGVQRDQAKCVVQVSERVHEGWVTVLNDGSETELRGLLEVSLSGLYFSTAEVLLVFF
jgi:hypothetical protein